MRSRVELLCVASGVVFVASFFVGLLIPGWIPPPGPNLTAEQVLAIYQQDANLIRAGMAICFIGTIFMFAFGAGVIGQVKRIPNVSPTLIQFQTLSVAGSVMIIVFPVMFWWVAAFRPDTRSAESVQLLNDLASMCFIIGFTPYVAWAAAVGMAVLSDRTPDPQFPRWSGYFSIFVGLAQMPPVVLVYTHTGPFAWNGLISWWVPMFDYFGWAVVMIVLSARSIRRVDPQPVPQPVGSGASS